VRVQVVEVEVQVLRILRVLRQRPRCLP